MNVLVPFTVAQHVARRMLLPSLLCFAVGTALQAVKGSQGGSCSTCPAWGAAGVGEARGSGLSGCSLCAHVCTLGQPARGERARVPSVSSSGYLCASSFPSFPSTAAEFRGCCCEGAG